MRTKCRIVQIDKSRMSDILPIKSEVTLILTPIFIYGGIYITSITNSLFQNNQPSTILLSFGRYMIAQSSKKYETFDPIRTFPDSTFGKIVLSENILIVIVKISLVLIYMDRVIISCSRN